MLVWPWPTGYVFRFRFCDPSSLPVAELFLYWQGWFTSNLNNVFREYPILHIAYVSLLLVISSVNNSDWHFRIRYVSHFVHKIGSESFSFLYWNFLNSIFYILLSDLHDERRQKNGYSILGPKDSQARYFKMLLV